MRGREDVWGRGQKGEGTGGQEAGRGRKGASGETERERERGGGEDHSQKLGTGTVYQMDAPRSSLRAQINGVGEK